jgi:YVTN family beta-propeller protein
MVATLLMTALLPTLVAQNAPPSGSRCVTQSDTYDISVPGSPIAAVPSGDEQTLFVSLISSNPTQQNGIGIVRCVGGRYKFDRTIALESQPSISTLSRDGKTLIVPDDGFIVFLDALRELAPSANAIAGYIGDLPNHDDGALYAMVSPDDRYAFVTEEQSGTLRVIDLQRVRASGATRDAIVSELLIGNAPTGLELSKDGKYLFATVQSALRRYNYPQTCKPESAMRGGSEAPGAIVTIDVAKAANDPEHAVVSNVPAGCHPVRAAISPDGSTLWVTARKDNAALAFSTEKLIADDPNAQTAVVPVGPAPVPVIVTPDGRYVLVGNSNRFGEGAGGNQSVVAIDTKTRAVVGQIPVGQFPRQFSVTKSGSTIFLCNFGSNTITVIDPAAIQRVMKPVGAS